MVETLPLVILEKTLLLLYLLDYSLEKANGVLYTQIIIKSKTDRKDGRVGEWKDKVTEIPN